MTGDASARQDREDLFVADFYPQLGEYLAERHATGYDADAGRSRFLAWLGEHAEADADDAIQDYLKQVSKVPGLSAEDEAELAGRIEAGRQAAEKLAEGGSSLSADQRIDLEWIEEYGLRARNHLLQANLRLVVAVARRFTGRGVPLLDLIHEGNLGLIRAAEHFDYTSGYRFTTYATWWIRQAITRALAAQRPAEAGPADRPADPEDPNGPGNPPPAGEPPAGPGR